MVVEFELKKVAAIRVGAIVRTGPWKKDNLRTEFGELTKWARTQGAKGGRWIFLEQGMKRWTACLEVKGAVKAKGRIRLRTLPASWVASATFDPDAVSPEVIYHGLNDWCRWRRREKKIRSVGGTREVYSGDPWKDAKAWAHAEVQFVVRK